MKRCASHPSAAPHSCIHPSPNLFVNSSHCRLEHPAAECVCVEGFTTNSLSDRHLANGDRGGCTAGESTSRLPRLQNRDGRFYMLSSAATTVLSLRSPNVTRWRFSHCALIIRIMKPDSFDRFTLAAIQSIAGANCATIRAIYRKGKRKKDGIFELAHAGIMA